jgi:hypothetical protein
MKIRILNKFNVDYLNETNREQIEVSEYDLSQIGITKCFDVENNRVIDYDNSEDLRIAKLEELRQRREQECFSIINRGSLWYDNLSGQQLEELEEWYHKWLDVTITLEAPEKPEWLK